MTDLWGHKKIIKLSMFIQKICDNHVLLRIKTTNTSKVTETPVTKDKHNFL